jgi:hypothetical protein
MPRGWIAIALIVPLVAAAEERPLDNDPDVEIARRHFAQASEFYSAGRYVEALAEFEIARKAKPVPELDYNIGRCHDRLEHAAEAIAAYQRYLGKVSSGAEADEVRGRIESLKKRIEPPPAPPAVEEPALKLVEPSPPPPAPSRALPMLFGGLGLVAVGVGGGLLISSGLGYQHLSSTCAPACAPSTWDGYPTLMTTGAVVAAAGVALLVIDMVVLLARRSSDGARIAQAR